MTARGGYRGGLEDSLFDFSDEDSRILGLGIPTTYDLQLSVLDGYSFTRVDQVGLTGSVGYFGTVLSAEDRALGLQNQEFASAGSELFWQRTLSPRSSVRFAGGVTLSYPLQEEVLRAFPTGNASHSTVWRGNGQTYNGTFRLGARAFFDPVTVTYRPQGFAEYSLRSTFGRDWSAGVTSFASTSMAREALVPQQFETVAGAEIPVRYTIARGLVLQFGGRTSVRGPHPDDFDDGDFQPEYSGFVGLRGTVGTDNSSGAWLP